MAFYDIRTTICDSPVCSAIHYENCEVFVIKDNGGHRMDGAVFREDW